MWLNRTKVDGLGYRYATAEGIYLGFRSGCQEFPYEEKRNRALKLLINTIMRSQSSTSNGKREKGFTLIENVFACALIALGLACTYTVNSQTMGVLRMAKDEAFASQVLQQRIEHLRIANWQRITSPTWIRDNILNVSADGGSSLAGVVETVTVVPYDNSSAGNTFTRTNGAASSSGGNASLLRQDAVTVKWKITWKGIPSGKVHDRETLAVLGKGGIAK